MAGRSAVSSLRRGWARHLPNFRVGLGKGRTESLTGLPILELSPVRRTPRFVWPVSALRRSEMQSNRRPPVLA